MAGQGAGMSPYVNNIYNNDEQGNRPPSVIGGRPSPQRGISNYPPEEIAKLHDKDFEEQLRTKIVEYKSSELGARRRLELKQFFLHSVFPYVETRLINSNYCSLDVLKVLPHLCCFDDDSQINQFSLHLILDVLSKARYDLDDNLKRFIVECEKTIRCSIAGENPSIFDAQTADDQGLRVFVYSRVLMLLVALIKQSQIPSALWKENEESLERLYQKLKSLQKTGQFVRKGRPRYAIACVRQARKSLATQRSDTISTKFICWLNEIYQSDVTDPRDIAKHIKKFVEDMRSKKSGWFDFHIIISCLIPKIHENSKMNSALRTLVEQYLLKIPKWTKETFWQTGVLLGDTLENLVMYHKDDFTRKEACATLCFYVNQLKDNKNSEEKPFIELSLERCCYGPRKSMQPMILSTLGIEKPVSRKLMEFLQTNRYRKQMSPSNFTFIGQDSTKALFKTHFRGEEAMVKILLISPDEIQRGGQREPSKQLENLIKEVHLLRPLNSYPHPNILRVFGYDTLTQPYHVVTEYVHNGTLSQYLQSTRLDTLSRPNPTSLIQMAIGIVDGLIFFMEHGLIHLAVTSDAVLVGNSYCSKICKITGFQALREMTYNKQTHSFEYISQDDETSIRHSSPEVMTGGRYTEKSMVFSLGYILFENHTMGVTPYNWLNNDDEIRSHVMKGGRLPEENCIPEPIKEIIHQCHLQDPQLRPDLASLRSLLGEARQMLENTDADRPSAELPPLSEQDLRHSQMQLSSCRALDNVERSKILGYFGSPTDARDIAVKLNIRGIPQIRERVEKTKEEDLKKLKELRAEHIVKVLCICDYDGRDMALMTENSEQGNLLSMVLAKRCNSLETIRLLVQALSGLVYMHDSNILHCDICAEHLMVFYTDHQGYTVKVSRLGRSRYLKTSPIVLPIESATRRNPPEVIKHKFYSCSSDGWQFCLMCYELFSAHDADKGSKPEDVHPFGKIPEKEILPYIEDTNNRPPRPTSMPEWLHITVKQGLLHNPEERPPLILLHDTMTYRKPFESCLLTRWKEFHPEKIMRDHIDVEVMQPASDHLVPSEDHLPFEVLRGLAPVAVFLKHSYEYDPGYKETFEEDIYEGCDPIYSFVEDRCPPSQAFPEETPTATSAAIPPLQEETRRPIHHQGRPPQPLPRQRLHQDTSHTDNPVKETSKDSGPDITSDSAQDNFRERANASLPSQSDNVELTDGDGAQTNGENATPFYENLEWLRQIMAAASDDGATEQSWHSVDSLPINKL